MEVKNITFLIIIKMKAKRIQIQKKKDLKAKEHKVVIIINYHLLFNKKK